MDISEGYSTTTKPPKRKKQQLNKIDRLSSLPDTILCHILSFLPTKSSVQTTILARRWRFLWAQVPNLELVGVQKDHDGINNVISLHKLTHINSFRLTYPWQHVYLEPKLYAKRQREIVAWITTALSRNVKKLEIDLHDDEADFERVFTSKTLVELSLRRLRFFPVHPTEYSSPTDLPRLKKLHLHLHRPMRETHSEECLPHLLSCCPVLEELIFERVENNSVFFDGDEHLTEDDPFCCYVSSPTLKKLKLNSQYHMGDYVPGTYSVEINAPALRYLDVEDWISERISVGELNHLIEANIFIFNMERKEDDVLHTRSVLGFVGRLCNVKHLKLACTFLKALDSTLGSWTIKFHNLTKLELTADWRFISMFLENADNLEDLTVCEVLEDLKCWTEPQKVPTCLLSHLKTIKIDRFECVVPEFELVRYILGNAKVLETMMVITQSAGTRARFNYVQERFLPALVTSGIGVELKLQALQIISSYERRSEACKVLFD